MTGCALFVADNAILIPMRRGPSAGTGLTVSTGGSLNGPLGLAVAPHGQE